MTIDEIIAEWKTDAKIDDLNIDREASEVSNKHAKYLEILSAERSKLRSLQIARRNLQNTLREYYLGNLSQEELAKLGREQFLQRVLKAEVMMFVDSDAQIISHDTRIQIQQEKVDVLMEIMKSINNRNFQLKNSIDFRRLMHGG